MSVDYNSFTFMSAKDDVPFVVSAFWDDNYETEVTFEELDNSLKIDFVEILKSENEVLDVQIKSDYDENRMYDRQLKEYFYEYDTNLEELLEKRKLPLHQAVDIIASAHVTNKDGNKLYLFSNCN